VAFDSCDQAVSGLRTASKAIVGPYGFGGGEVWAADGAMLAEGRGAAPPPGVPAPAQAGAATADKGLGGGTNNNYSGTNTHEAGVDEPDLVKTDGRRIVTVSGGVLRVVDPESRAVTGFVDLADPDDPSSRYIAGDILLSGDHALVLLNQAYFGRGGPIMEDAKSSPQQSIGPRLILVDLVGQPRVLSSMVVDGALVDARQVGSTARVVIRSAPRLMFPYLQNTTDKARTKANQSIIDNAPLERWVPRIQVTTNGSTQTSTVPCEAISRPASYSGTNLLTILSIDVAGSALGDGRPVTLAADGDTVYSNGPSLYVASNQTWRIKPGGEWKPQDARTEIYKFDTSSSDRPRYVAGGGVPGYLINQYAMSDFEGNLRVATTTGQPWGNGRERSQSGVYVLAQRDNSLRQIGRVEGLGKGERIFAVRFLGPVGYVVTFRQTDPLYTVDLHDPTKPRVRGALKIPGYSAYLHPVGSDRLIGIGQDATSEGRVKGTQVSLFDVSDLSDPRRIATYSLTGAHSEAEFDPHAFLYWPPTGLLVVPLQVYRGADVAPGGDSAVVDKMMPSVGALVLRVSDRSIGEISFISHPYTDQTNKAYSPGIRRSLVIGDTLWTVSDGGLMANDLFSVARQSWLAYE
jgi:hypothetical protein